MIPQHLKLIPFGNDAAYCKEHDLFFGSAATNREPSKPLSVCIGTGTRCNLVCAVCSSDSKPRGRFVAHEQIEQLLEWLKQFAPLRLVWSGGEPTLLPQIRALVEASIDHNFHNVVTTNMSAGDPLVDLAGQFSYAVSLYGTDEASYFDSTHHRRGFWDFRRHFDTLFANGQIVCVNLRIESGWWKYVPACLTWLKAYPIKKLLLSNTRSGGRVLGTHRAAGESELAELLQYLQSEPTTFPIVYPAPQTVGKIEQGYLYMEPALDTPDSVLVAGRLCRGADEVISAVAARAADNRRLFLMQSYICPAHWLTSDGHA
jgi:hypothetical protein